MARPKDPEERRRIVAQAERKDKTARLIRSTAIIAGILIVVGGAIGAAVYISIKYAPPPQVHWHATYQIWTNDQRQSITSAGMFFDNMPRDQLYLGAHIHQCNPNLVHNEGREGEGHFTDVFNLNWRAQGAKLSDTEFVAPVGLSFPGDYKADAEHPLQLFVSHANGTWEKTDIQGYSFQNSDRLLLIYGNDTAAQIQAKEDAFPLFETKDLC